TQTFADYVGIGVHCAQNSAICGASTDAQADVLPDEPRGYNGFNALMGARYVNPVIKPGADMTDLGNHLIKDQNNHIGFPGCDGVTVACDYTGKPVGEIYGNLSAMIRTQYGDTTPFTVHSDDAPNVYITGNPSQTNPITRNLEREMAQLHWKNPYTGQDEPN